MADVDGGGQIVLVAALGLAAMFVGLALVLNAVIFTENLATRQTTEDVDASREYQAVMNETISDALATANTNPNNASHATLRQNLSDNVQNQMLGLQRDATVGGGSVSVSLDDTTGGFLLQQTNASRNLTGGGAHRGERNWTLATGAAADTEFRQNLSRDATLEATVDTTMDVVRNQAYTVRISNDTYTWNVYVMHWTDGNILFVTERSDASMTGKIVKYYNRSCTRNTEFVRIDYHAGTAKGTSCRAVAFYPAVTGEVDITYNNTEVADDVRARGTYQLRVANSSVHRDAFHAVSDNRSPYKATALLGSEVALAHQTMDHLFRSSLRVPAPSLGQVGTAERNPTVTSFSVTDRTDDTEVYDFEVTAEANDPDGNLDYATFNITDDEGREIENVTVDVSGGVDSAPHRFANTSLGALLEEDGNFTLWVTVYDATGRIDSYGETHKADGDGTHDGDEYPAYSGVEVSASGEQAGATDPALARATPTPPAEGTVSTADVDATVAPVGVNEPTNTTGVEGDL